MKKYIMISLKNLCVITCLFLGAISSYAVNRNTITAGNWSSNSTWNGASSVPTKDDNVTIDHSVNLDANWGPQNSGSITINATSSGSGTLNMSGGSLIINANVTLTGTGVNLTGGTLTVKSGFTLIMPGFNQANTNIVVESGATLIVNGNFLDNHGNTNVDGLITVIGNYDGQANDATVTGNGNITSTGSMIGINNSSIFGYLNPYCPSNCDGRNLFGGGNCNGTATAIPNATSVCSGVPVLFTSTLTGGYSNGQPLVYQWQIKNASGFFINISGATSSTYSVSPLVTSEYRVAIGDKLNSSDPYCYKFSAGVSITVTSCIKNWVGGTVGDESNWHVANNWSPSGIPGSTDDISISNTINHPVISAGTTAHVKNITINTSSNLEIPANCVLNVYGNITNSGVVTTAPGSTINMVGSTAQTITGVSSVYNLSVNNSSGVSLATAITVNGAISLVNGALTTNNHLTVNFDNGGNVNYAATDNGSIVGNVSGRRDVVAKSHYIAAPFSGVTSAQVAETTPLWVSPYWKMYSRVFSTQNWSAVINTTTAMPLGTGFSLSFTTAAPLTLTGTYNHAYTFTSPSYDNILANKYILVGNPYPSTLDWNNGAGWTKTNIGDAIYLWDAASQQTGSYVAGVSTNGGTQYIPAMQSFLVRTSGGGGFATIGINNNARISLQNPSYWRVGHDETIRITLQAENSTQKDEAVIRFNDMATTAFDADLDAGKILNGGLVPSVYTTVGTELYSINSLTDAYSMTSIPLAAKLPVDGNYVLHVENSDPNIYYVLIDKKLGTENFVSGTSYTFSGLKANDGNRFELQLRVGTTTGNNNNFVSNYSGLEIYSSSNGFVLQTQQFGGSVVDIEIVDLTGTTKLMLPNKTLVSGATFVPLEIADGTYIAKVFVDGKSFAKLITLVK
jgi:hypothetical protein